MNRSRREFLKQIFFLGAGLFLGASCKGEGQVSLQSSGAQGTSGPEKEICEELSRIAIVRHSKAQEDGKLNKEALREMLDYALPKVAETESVEEAWEELFKPEDIVGMKVNCLAGPTFSSHVELIDVIVEGLVSADIPRNHIIVWDKTNRELVRAGYELRTSGDDELVFGTDTEGVGYESEVQTLGKVKTQLSRIIAEFVTALINVPILKDHDMAGVTVSMKNHYGSLLNPVPYHGNRCDPYIADLNTAPAIKDKTRLIVCDAVNAVCQGGPSDNPRYKWKYNGLLVGKDPVAVDYLGWQIIEARRADVDLPSLAEAGREPTYIEAAAQRGLGTNEPAQMEIFEVELGE